MLDSDKKAKTFSFSGHFRDYEGSYDGLYYLLSGGVFCVTLIWCVVVIYERRSTGSPVGEDNMNRTILARCSSTKRLQEDFEELGSS